LIVCRWSLRIEPELVKGVTNREDSKKKLTQNTPPAIVAVDREFIGKKEALLNKEDPPPPQVPSILKFLCG